MEFIGLKIIGSLVVFSLGFVLGRYWPDVNSVSDIENVYAKTVAKVEQLKAQAKAQIADAEAKIEKLKSLV